MSKVEWGLVRDERRNDYYAGDFFILFRRGTPEAVWYGHSNNAEELLRLVLGDDLEVVKGDTKDAYLW